MIVFFLFKLILREDVEEDTLVVLPSLVINLSTGSLCPKGTGYVHPDDNDEKCGGLTRISFSVLPFVMEVVPSANIEVATDRYDCEPGLCLRDRGL